MLTTSSSIWKSDIMSEARVSAVTLIGQKHRQRGIPCEDASFAGSRNGVSVVVVADGAGSKQYTHARYGSAAAVKTISDLMMDHFDAIYNENREAAVRNLIIAALHVSFADLIREHKLDSIDRLSCTLLFCAVKDRRVLVGHIGDGLIVRISPEGVSPLTMPQNGTNASSTYFVTAPHAADYMRLIKTTTDDLHAIALMTDGVQDSVYDENSGLVKPVVARMAETLSAGREKSEAEIKGILEKYIVGGSNNSDDASFGILYLADTKGPDTKKLPTGADAFPRASETFKDLQNELLPEVKKARNVIVEAKANTQVGKNEDEEHPTRKNAEQEYSAKETPDSIKKILQSTKRMSMLVCSLAIVEFIAIIVLIIKIFFLK